MQITEALESYLLQLRGDGRSPHTINQAERFVTLLASSLCASGHSALLSDVRHEDLARFFSSDVFRMRARGGPRKPTSGNAMRSVIRTFFSYVHAAGYTTTNPARLVQRARCTAPPPKALLDADCDRLLAALSGASTTSEVRDRALFHTLLSVGLRVGSAIQLDVADVDLEAGEARLRRMKGGAEDTVFLPPATVATLREYVGERRSGPLFLASHGGRMTARSVHRRLCEWAVRAGIGRHVHPHMMRHTFGTRLFRSTSNVLLVARALCHRSVASTAIYVRVDGNAVREAVDRVSCAPIAVAFKNRP